MTTTADDDSTGPDPTLDVPVEAAVQVEAVMSPDPSFWEWVHALDTTRETTRVEALAVVKNAKAVQAAADVAVLQSIVDWCVINEALTDDEAMWIAGYGDYGLALGGIGCPLVRESAVIELSAVLGVSTRSGANQVAVTLELRYRLPRLWERVLSGACPVWRARQVAEKTMGLCEDGAAEVDRLVAPFAHSISYAQLSRITDEALLRWDPQAAEEKRRAAADGRHCHINLAQHPDGVVDLDAGLDLADAIALEAAVSDRAKTLAADGSTDSLDVRRSQALGSLALGEQTLPDGQEQASPATGKHLVLYAHIPGAVFNPLFCTTSPTSATQLSRLDNRHPAKGPITTAQVRQWAHTAASITIRPVIDLAESIHCDSYECSDRLKEQTALRDLTCVFPWCTNPAVFADMDHVIPHPDGPTETGNVAPACRQHHRAKTHMGWNYNLLGPGLYLWTSPIGQRYLRSHAGTHPIDELPPGPPPDPL
ncbi:HNH endonuclease signature motif containing protein, partial [Nocardioides aquaticus]|uniref:HNH endonuclease signature motif containing protein n=1 Tax=Nocardioides aquaticus TaxID=160826 RepID=UPI0031D589D7